MLIKLKRHEPLSKRPGECLCVMDNENTAMHYSFYNLESNLEFYYWVSGESINWLEEISSFEGWKAYSCEE